MNSNDKWHVKNFKIQYDALQTDGSCLRVIIGHSGTLDYRLENAS